RSYDSKSGKYTQADPIGLEGGANRFAYVGGNPLSYMDPMGLDASMVLPAAGAAGAGMSLAPWVAPAAGAAVVGAGSYWLTDKYVNPWLQPLISQGIESCGNAIDDLLTYAKGGRQNVRDTGLIGVSDEEIDRRLRSPGTSAEEKKRLQREQKARGERNKRKRAGS
ncbi:RHS repeat-associated core domain-containing protein, partial [Acidovorax sp. LjRoot117]|uniref:RHS repeat-associated core domain-containing protein n=1 Tax=Acidovorax sp. LjRoot117 TaxID=3342255 RepID=UPI003F4FEF4E